MGIIETIKSMSRVPKAQWRFWEKVDTSGECWIWESAKTPGGYGLFHYEGKARPAHRVAYQFVYGSVPDDLVLRHLCNNPSCVNPLHLEPGTHQDNTNDKMQAGRHIYERRRISEETRAAMIADYEAGRGTQTEIADRYGVGHREASKILKHSDYRARPGPKLGNRKQRGAK